MNYKDVSTVISLSSHCQHICKILHMKHQYHLNKRKKIRNILVELNIDNDYQILKKIYCLSIGKSIDSVMDSNRICLKISKAIMKGREIINICTNMIRVISMKYDWDYNNDMKYFLPIIATDDKEDENIHIDPTAIIEENIHLEIMKPKK